MRLTFHTDGGFAVFPGLQQPFSVLTSDLGADDAAVLQQLATDAMARHDATSKPVSGGADQITYTVEIVDDHHRHSTLRATDPVQDSALRALIDRLSELRAKQ